MIFDLLKFGFFYGILIALISLGFGLIYNIMKIVDFAHTDRITLSSYLFIILNEYFNIYFSITISILICILFTILIERFLYSPLLKKGTTPVMMTSFGLSIILQSILALIFSSALKVSSISEDAITGIGLYPRELILLPILVVSIFLLNNWLKNYKLGKAIRAIVSNRERAIFFNVPVKRLQSSIFAISGLFAGIAGISIAIGSGITPTTGFKYMIFSFSACLVGGLKSLWGIIIIGVLFGILLVFAEAFGSALLSEALVLCILVIVLLVKPEGLFGEKLRII
ncbi:MAG: branched-chain amino acid ABC transporter permease [Ignavibacteriales bacterium]|nr:branched-chain amino acid ABC transporter permease [Ignavibacteriales bacterium]